MPNFQCGECGHAIKKGEKFCKNCGAELMRKNEKTQKEFSKEESIVFQCGECGHIVTKGAKFCKNCGAELIRDKKTDTQKLNHKKEDNIEQILCPICGNNKDKISPLCNSCIDAFYGLIIDSIQRNQNFDMYDFVDTQNELILSRGNGKSFNSCITCNLNNIGNGSFLCDDCMDTFMNMYVKFSDINGRLGKTSKEIFKNALYMTKGKADLINLVHKNIKF